MTGQRAVDQDDGEYTHHIDAAVSGDGNDGLEGSEIDTCRRQGAMVSNAYPGYKMRLSLPQTEGGRQVGSDSGLRDGLRKQKRRGQQATYQRHS